MHIHENVFSEYSHLFIHTKPKHKTQCIRVQLMHMKMYSQSTVTFSFTQNQNIKHNALEYNSCSHLEPVYNHPYTQSLLTPCTTTHNIHVEQCFLRVQPPVHPVPKPIHTPHTTCTFSEHSLKHTQTL